MMAQESDVAAVGSVAERGEAGRLPPKRKKWRPVQWMCFGIALVPIISFIVFSGVPVVLSFISMFTDMDYNDLTTIRWNDYANFINVFQDSRFWKSWGTTFWLASAQVVTLLIALVISVLLNSIKRFNNVFQVIFFIPYICSSVAIAIMWRWIFSTDLGVINAVLGKNVEWLNSYDQPTRLVWCVYITILWQAPAYGIVMFKAALKNVNPSLYEAASIDGANGFHKFWNVTLPGIKGVTLFLLLASITNGLSVFDSVTILAPIDWTGVAGPDDVGLTVNYYIYLMGVKNRDMEYASVISWVLFVVTFLISFFVIRARNKATAEE